MGRNLAILLRLGCLGGCAALDDGAAGEHDNDWPTHVDRVDAYSDKQFRRTTRVTSDDGTRESTKAWNQQEDGSWKYAGKQK